ncbi:hypothetical protein GGC65_004190 [Sphingopyxis sp. OAS728]|nr:hypothetical protein [Sphingopyxis sp. OAS728]
MRRKFDWDGDWAAVTAFEAIWAEEELRRELPAGHTLYHQMCTAAGRRQRSDDYLFRLIDGRFAQVRLARKAETDPHLPETKIFPTFKGWKANLAGDL